MTYDNKYTQADLKSLGFSKKLIELLLPNPELRKNPMYKSAAPMKVYEAENVTLAMETETFKKHIESSEKRKISAQKAVQTKIDNLLEVVSEKIKDLQVYKDECVLDKALKEKQKYYYSIGKVENDVYTAEHYTVNRWVVNYIRHQLTEYDDELYRLSGKIGCHEAYIVYKNAVLDKIAEIYPQYADECESQKAYY